MYIQKKSIALSIMGLGLAFGIGFLATPSLANTLSTLYEPSLINNGTASNALSIIQRTDVSKSRSSGGALQIDNTGNDNTGLTVYSNAGASVLQPLMRMEVDNPAFDQEVLYINSDSPTSRGLIRLDSPAPEIEFVETDQGTGAAGKFEIRIQHDTFQINSRRADDTTFENKIHMTHGGDLVLEKGKLEVNGSAPSEFAGGINVTGGCIAFNGKCVIGDGATLPKTSTESTSEPVSVGGSAVIKITDGAPASLDCNSNTERGAMTLDKQNNRLYICNGPERGWDYTVLSD